MKRSLPSPGRARGRLLAILVATAALAVTAASPATALADSDGDPLGGLNRGVFRFNEALDRWALEPVARGYDRVMPDIVQGWVGNFTANLWFPVVFTNCLLQAKPDEAAQSFGRFFVNTTLGLGGFGDPATRLDVPRPHEDFGQTLGAWGVPPGPYLVLPFFGPSNVRDTFGRVADSAGRVWPYFVPWYVSSGEGVLEIVDTRARFLDEVSDLRESSLDYYVAVRNAYVQRREALVEDRVGATDDGGATTLSEDDLYFPGETPGDTP